MRTALDITATHVLRTARRYGLDLAIARRTLLLLSAAALVAAATAGGAAGHLTGASAGGAGTRPAALTALTVLLSAAVAVLGLTVVASPARELQTALDSPRGWSVLAQAGVDPATYVLGRYALLEAVKASLVVAAHGAYLALLVPAAPAVAGVPALAAACWSVVLAAALARAVAVLRRTARRTAGRRGASARHRAAPVLAAGLAALAAGGALAAAVRSDALEDPAAARRLAAGAAERGSLALGAGLVAVALLAVALRQAWGVLADVRWADVLEAAARRKALRVEAPALPPGPLRAITAVDARRMLRSASVRLRPVGSAAAVVGLVLTASGAWAALGGRASLPSDVPRGQLAAGAVAFVAYGAVAASASLLAMDADRHALTLWQLVPGAVRRVAAARAAQGAVLASAVAAPAVVASGWLLGLTAGELVVCAAAAATMAVVGPVLDLLGSLRWPQVDWVEASEIGTSHPARYAIGFAVGIPVVGVVAALGQSTAGAGRGLLLLAAAGLAAAAPLLAAALMRVALLLCGRQIHA